MTKKYIIANWKMNCGGADGIQYFEDVISSMLSKDKNNLDIIVCPPMVLLRDFFKIGKDTFLLGAQNCAIQDCGAFTGEVSASMLKEAGCHYVIVGHSERRQHFGETDRIIQEKACQALSAGLIPIICVGESFDERQSGHMYDRVASQVIEATRGVKNFILAYEPIWAIGTGLVADPRDIEEMTVYLKTLIPHETSVLYGGSVHGGNIQEITKILSLDGVLVGGASLKKEDFLKIIETMKRV